MEFNPDGYKKMLETALNSGYQFKGFHEREIPGNVCLLRHDIDADLEAALKLATIEHDLNIRSTYFIMLRSPIYNIFGRANDQRLREIISLGHHIGLHYDEGYQWGTDRSLDECVNMEAKFLGSMFDLEIKTVSFHQPGPKILNNEIKLSRLINTYDRDDMQHFMYISDSNKVWKDKTPLQLFQEAHLAKIHLLIHPMWWSRDTVESTEVVWEKTLQDNFLRSQEQVLATERAYGKEREIIIREKR